MASKRKYLVGIREVHVRTIEVEADSAREAKNMAGAAPFGDEVIVEFSHTMSEDHWSVEEVPPE